MRAALEGARAAYGLVQLARPGVMAKVLGARLVLQAAVTVLATSHADERTRRLVHEIGVAVDALHSTSMVGLAVWSSRRRGEGIHQAVVAGAFAAAEAVVAR
jgi:hypothetical protein